VTVAERATTLDGGQIELDEAAVEALSLALGGQLIRPGDPGYDAARRVNNALIDRRPALIARCRGAADVVAAVTFAREQRLLLSVRGGGHNVAGSAIADGGLVVDLSAMRGVRVDPAARTVRAGGGATWADVDRETQLFGLAAPGGAVSTTGVGGLTLGGGYGHLRRKHGTSCDNLLSVDVVTADGRLRTASATEHADLFWAVRGGGGNFGVVTSLEFRCHPIGPIVALAAPIYAFEEAGRIARGWRDFMAAAPDEVSSNLILWSMPPLPTVPAEQHGRPVVILAAIYAGSADVGETVMRPLRELSTPLADLSGQMPYTVLQSAFDSFFPYGRLRYYWKSLHLDGLTDQTLDAVVERAAGLPTPQSLVALWHHGGAMHRGGASETAFAGRTAPVLLSLDTTWADPADDERCIGWTRRFWSEMHAHSSGGVYLNFGGFGEEREELVRAAFGPSYERLAAIKREYDPTNLFRMNHNIPPSVESAG
jgi:FAD/FMN-containing dehydrogenase